MDTPTARSLGVSTEPRESKMPDYLPTALADASNPNGQLTAACLILGIDQKTLTDRSKEFKTVKDQVCDENGLLLHLKSFQDLAPLAEAQTPDEIKRTRKKIVKDAFDLKYETVQVDDLPLVINAQDWLNIFIENNCYLILEPSFENLIFSELSDVEKKNFITSLLKMQGEDITKIGIKNLLEIYSHLSDSNEHAGALLKINNAIQEKNRKSREQLNSLLEGTGQEEIIYAEALQIRQQELFKNRSENECKIFRKDVLEFENDVMRAIITRSVIWNNKGKIVLYFFVGAIVGIALVAGGLPCVLLATGTAMALVTAAAIVATIGTIAGLIVAGIRIYNKPTRIFQEPDELITFAKSLTEPLKAPRPEKRPPRLLRKKTERGKSESDYYDRRASQRGTPELQSGESIPDGAWASSAEIETSSHRLSKEERRKQQRAQQRAQLTPEQQLMCHFYDLHDAAREKKYFGKQAPRWWEVSHFPVTFEDVIIHALKNPTNSDGTGGNLTAQIFYQVCGFPVDRMYDAEYKAISPEANKLRSALETAWIAFRKSEKLELDMFHEKHKARKDADAEKAFLCFFKRPTHTQVKNEFVDAYLPDRTKIQTQRSLVEIIDKSRSSNCVTLFFKRLCPFVYTGNRSAAVLADGGTDIRDADNAKISSEQLTKRLVKC